MTPGQEYARDWHQCVRCGCTYGLKELELVRRVDVVLSIDERVFICLDLERCARFKLEREEHLRHDIEHVAIARAAELIKRRTS